MNMTQSGILGIIDQEVTAIIADIATAGYALREYKHPKYIEAAQDKVLYVYRSTVVAKLREKGYYVDQINTSWEETRFAVGYIYPVP